jgi:hypothetical protein
MISKIQITNNKIQIKSNLTNFKIKIVAMSGASSQGLGFMENVLNL